MLPKAQQRDVVVVVAGRDATAVSKDRGGQKGGGSWHGGDGRAACGCDCGGDISRSVLEKGIFVVSESVWSSAGGKSKSNNNVVLVVGAFGHSPAKTNHRNASPQRLRQGNNTSDRCGRKKGSFGTVRG